MADGIRNGLGIGRLFEPVWQLQPDRERFIPVMESYWKTYPPVYPSVDFTYKDSAHILTSLINVG
ncbi:hypothetical protein HAZ92_RS22940 [Escherichia coli]|nr:hypothetical protein [Escherichia coli]